RCHACRSGGRTPRAPESSAPARARERAGAASRLSLGAGPPGLIIAGRGCAASPALERTLGAIGAGASGQVRRRLLLPRARRGQHFSRQFVERAMQPAVPFGRHAARVVGPLVDDPAPLAVARAVLTVAERVRAHFRARTPA